MNCEGARDSIILAAYSELPDDLAIGLEQHLSTCEDCQAEWDALRRLDDALALNPLMEVDPNLVAQSRMRLDEALDAMPQHGFLTRVQASAMAWLGHLQGAPALATLLVGLGFLAGNLTFRYQQTHRPQGPPFVVLSGPGGGISTISGITRLPNDMVQVNYDRVVSEVAEGSLDNPQIRQLLMFGSNAGAANNGVRTSSVALISGECRIGHECVTQPDGTGLRAALLTCVQTDRNPGVRMKALDGLQPYVSQDERVRDTIAQVLLNDTSSLVRAKAIDILKPVQADTSVRQVLRTVSTTDDNPYIRTVSTQALSSNSMQ